MLVLTRRIDEALIIDGNITITILDIKGRQARIGIEAPQEISIDREEIHERKCLEADAAGEVLG